MSHLISVAQAGTPSEATNGLAGWFNVLKTGVSNNIVVTPAMIWGPNIDYPFMTVAQPLEVVSTSAQDAPGGTGASAVLIEGLNANWDPQFESVVLNGTTPVPTISSWIRINGMRVISAGSTENNVGVLTLRRLGGGATQEYINSTIGIARTALYSVPRDYTLFISLFSIDSLNLGNATADMVLESNTRDGDTQVWRKTVRMKLRGDGNIPYHHMADPPVVVPERSDYWWRIVAIGAGTAPAVAAYFSGSLMNKSTYNTLGETPRW